MERRGIQPDRHRHTRSNDFVENLSETVNGASQSTHLMSPSRSLSEDCCDLVTVHRRTFLIASTLRSSLKIPGERALPSLGLRFQINGRARRQNESCDSPEVDATVYEVYLCIKQDQL